MSVEYRGYGDNSVLVDPDGTEWREITGWLEPREVRAMAKMDDVRVVVDLCEGARWDAELTDDIMGHVVTSLESHRLARGKSSGNVIYAPSLWGNEGGGRLIVLSEEAAKKRKIIRELRGSCRLGDLVTEGWFRDDEPGS